LNPVSYKEAQRDKKLLGAKVGILEWMGAEKRKHNKESEREIKRPEREARPREQSGMGETERGRRDHSSAGRGQCER